MLELLIALLLTFLNSDRYNMRENAQFIVETINNTFDIRKQLRYTESLKDTPLETKRRIGRAMRSYNGVRPYFFKEFPLFICYNGTGEASWRTEFRDCYWHIPAFVNTDGFQMDGRWNPKPNATKSKLRSITKHLIERWLDEKDRHTVRLRLTFMAINEKLGIYYSIEELGVKYRITKPYND